MSGNFLSLTINSDMTELPSAGIGVYGLFLIGVREITDVANLVHGPLTGSGTAKRSAVVTGRAKIFK